MKRKVILCLLLIGIFITGCGKNNTGNVVKNLDNKVKNLKSYKLEGNLEIVNNDNTFNYRVSVDYKENDKYKVSLKNIANNHEQIILKNDDGVYVVTPSLNKSFKFQSEWPNNNSQVYILENIMNDICNDKNNKVYEDNDNYIIESSVNYPNNENLVKQRVEVDNDLIFKKVEVLDKDNNPYMIFTIDSVNYKPNYDENYFEINSIINESNQQDDNKNSNDKSEKTSTLDDIIYPLYVPTGTSLTKEEKVSKTDGERIILTFGGNKSFTLVEEVAVVNDELTVVPTYGEPYMLLDTVASLSSNSLNWVSNGIEYYIVSDVMNQNELIKVAESLITVSSLK